MAVVGQAENLRLDVVALFEGDVGAAEQAIEDLAADPEVLSAWATRMLRHDDPYARAFRWSEIPGPIRQAAVRGMAMAYLLESWGGLTREDVNHANATYGRRS